MLAGPMGKKSKKDRGVDTSGADALKHNPFAALGGGLDLPAGPEEAAPVETPEPEAGPTRLPGKLVVRREKKGRGGKTVTRVSGLPEAHREALAARMKKALGCGAAHEEDDVILLGDVVDRAADWLEAEGAKRVSRGK